MANFNAMAAAMKGLRPAGIHPELAAAADNTWQLATDANTGKQYYWNEGTREVRWDFPAVTRTYNSAATAAGKRTDRHLRFAPSSSPDTAVTSTMAEVGCGMCAARVVPFWSNRVALVWPFSTQQDNACLHLERRCCAGGGLDACQRCLLSRLAAAEPYTAAASNDRTKWPALAAKSRPLLLEHAALGDQLRAWPTAYHLLLTPFRVRRTRRPSCCSTCWTPTATASLTKQS